MDLNNTKELVKKVLLDDLGSRNSDNRLYANVCKLLNLKATQRPFYEVIEFPEKYGFPTYETVRRSRQKIQEECPELGADTRTKQKRMECEQMYLDFVRR